MSSSSHPPSWPDPVWPGLGLGVWAPSELVRVGEQVLEQTPQPNATPIPMRVYPSGPGSPALSLLCREPWWGHDHHHARGWLLAGGRWTVGVPAPLQSHSPHFGGCWTTTAHPSWHCCCLIPGKLLLGDLGLGAGLKSEYMLLTALQGPDDVVNLGHNLH